MDTNITQKLCDILAIGETVTVEFKRCRDSVSASTYETICAFLNRFGGDIYLGVEDNGTVVGVLEKSASDIVKNIISTVSNPNVISPTTHLSPKILKYEGKCVIHIHVPPSSEVHSYKKDIYDRTDDADVKVTATGAIAAMYIRKQKIHTEKKVYPFVRDEHLRLDMLSRIRIMAKNHSLGNHPWVQMSDREILQSAGLIGEDVETGKSGYNLAAIMLFGRDETILSACPAYRTDAIVRKVNLDRYDDRLMARTNLIESYDSLMKFAEVHLPDKFYLENNLTRVSLRNGIAREMLVNTLIHREFTSSYVARFIIEKDRAYTENANRAERTGLITPENFQPNPKNPIIASFFRNIGLADELGSGVRRLYYYTRRYSGKDPQLIDGDVFRIIVPLDETYSYDVKYNTNEIATKISGCTLTENAILDYLRNNPTASQKNVAESIGKSLRQIKIYMAKLQSGGILKREGTNRRGRWLIMGGCNRQRMVQ